MLLKKAYLVHWDMYWTIRYRIIVQVKVMIHLKECWAFSIDSCPGFFAIYLGIHVHLVLSWLVHNFCGSPLDN